jgi:hypothetical protein
MAINPLTERFTMPRTDATTTTRDLAAEHLALIAQRESAGAGQAAAITRKITALELRMIVEGVEFTPYTPPVKGKVTLSDLSPDQLLAAHAGAIKDRQDAATAGVKAGATTRIKKLQVEMTSRKIDFTPADLGAGEMTDDQIRLQIKQLRTVAKSKIASPAVVKLAARQVAEFERKASERQIKI